MTNFLIGLSSGLAVGGFLGVLVMAILSVNKDEE